MQIPVGPPTPTLDFASWIVWEDEHIVIVNKPAGVLSQGGEGGRGVNLVDLARAHYGKKNIGVAHRLDRNVSGLVIIPKTVESAKTIGAKMRDHAVQKLYRGVVRGVVAEHGWFLIEALLKKDEAKNEVRAVSAAELLAMKPGTGALFQPARTKVMVVARHRSPMGPIAELDLVPLTGRSHQLRAHLAYRGLPLIGDPKYGIMASGVNRPLLHAWKLTFSHPRGNKVLEVECPPPWNTELLSRLRAAPKPFLHVAGRRRL